jgi:hypothetical protein
VRAVIYILLLGVLLNIFTSPVNPRSVIGAIILGALAALNHFVIDPWIYERRIELHRSQLLHLLRIYFEARWMTMAQIAYVEAGLAKGRSKEPDDKEPPKKSRFGMSWKRRHKKP